MRAALAVKPMGSDDTGSGRVKLVVVLLLERERGTTGMIGLLIL